MPVVSAKASSQIMNGLSPSGMPVSHSSVRRKSPNVRVNNEYRPVLGGVHGVKRAVHRCVRRFKRQVLTNRMTPDRCRSTSHHPTVSAWCSSAARRVPSVRSRASSRSSFLPVPWCRRSGYDDLDADAAVLRQTWREGSAEQNASLVRCFNVERQP